MLEQSEARKTWNLLSGDVLKLYVDEASNINGAGVGVVIITPCGVLLENAITINFPATNNEAEYEALLAKLRVTAHLQVEDLHVFCDSQLITTKLWEITRLGTLECWSVWNPS
ncbi:hypothetical protein RHMOL_Rhmol11G0089800 [Rhododendron molle]|uniref:Uncharacterized protein n=1 Tax=Rhododendron molle TaxID=49168 RepID=A0ACC0LQC0_RHOML|nr:hypothetical protein RHMOL_Rhmol11G0089800 [Rhododendron molle]